ncbi:MULTISPECIES: 50S ribosomal protein L30 [unclassified Collinsella]|uniref:50S ribosomal protein L30 n=1 Tax=unclassified Collinsella TaxID=2637548 RepID=UPI0011CA3723|nr:MULTISPECIES: 50S ribosomal protein L30 [unclassified Collinsella]TXF35964.1 50S ribosomal protein L30 [Collinsella sp. BA40]
MANTIKIKQVRSTNGCKEDQRRTVRALGLNKINATREITDNESVRGMIFKVKHLVEIVEE